VKSAVKITCKKTMKKWILLITGILLIGTFVIGIKIYYALDHLEKGFKSEHSLLEPNIKIITDSISPNKEHKYYEYQFDNGGFGYSRVYWSVIENKVNKYDLEKGLIPSGFQIVGWSNENELILEKCRPYIEFNAEYIMTGKTEFNGVKIIISE